MNQIPIYNKNIVGRYGTGIDGTNIVATNTVVDRVSTDTDTNSFTYKINHPNSYRAAFFGLKSIVNVINTHRHNYEEYYAPSKTFGVLGGVTSTETIKQHVYAQLSEASYYPNSHGQGTGSNIEDQNMYTKVVTEHEFTKEFEKDLELSQANHTIFHNFNTGETVVAFRGTSNLKDVGTDARLVAGVERDSIRYKQSEHVLRNVMAKYGGKENLTLTGHSLGGGIAHTLGQKFGIESHTFNPAISITNVMDSFRQPKTSTNLHVRQYVYRTPTDPVSVGSLLLNRTHVDVNHVAPHEANLTTPLLGEHAVNNFHTVNVGNSSNIDHETGTISVHSRPSNIGAVLSTLGHVMDVAMFGVALADTTSEISKANQHKDSISNSTSHTEEGAQEHTNEISQTLNPFGSINLDPDFRWTRTSVPKVIKKIVDPFRSSHSKAETFADKVVSTKRSTTFEEVDDHTIMNKKTKTRYVQVMGQPQH
jgi:hypothetical protein